jgi:hypothetical protein
MGFCAVMSITYGMIKIKDTEINELNDSNEFARHDHMSFINMCGLIAVPILMGG